MICEFYFNKAVQKEIKKEYIRNDFSYITETGHTNPHHQNQDSSYPGREDSD